MNRILPTVVGILALVFLTLFITFEAIRGQTKDSTWETLVAKRRQVMAEHELRRNEIVARLEFRPTVESPASFVNYCSFNVAPVAESSIDPARSLFVRDLATLSGNDFSLKRTLQQIADQVRTYVGPTLTATDIYRQFWDTQNSPPGVLSGPHCTGTLNDFPIDCPRNEGSEARGSDADVESRINEYKVLALVNRFDLAHEGWRNCGEYRIIYGKYLDDNGRNFIIFEGVLPNPKPGCREGCLPVAAFWHKLSEVTDGRERASRLANFYYSGLEGFRPVVHVDR